MIVDAHFKRAFAAGDEGEGFDDVLVVFHDVGCRTDSALDVVSRDAVFNGDGVGFFHRGVSRDSGWLVDAGITLLYHRACGKEHETQPSPTNSQLPKSEMLRSAGAERSISREP